MKIRPQWAFVQVECLKPQKVHSVAFFREYRSQVMNCPVCPKANTENTAQWFRLRPTHRQETSNPMEGPNLSLPASVGVGLS